MSVQSTPAGYIHQLGGPIDRVVAFKILAHNAALATLPQETLAGPNASKSATDLYIENFKNSGQPSSYRNP